MRVLNVSGKKIMVYNDGEMIDSKDSIANLMVKANSECSCWLVALDKNMTSPALFNLSTGLFYEFLQKVKFHSLKIAIFGDFAAENMSELKKAVAENHAESFVYFVATRQEAVKLLQEK